MSVSDLSLAIIGGTGNLGYALAGRWARAGFEITIGSRSVDKAAEAAARIEADGATKPVAGLTNEAAAGKADVIIVTVPFSSQTAILQSIAKASAGKLVVDSTVPLVPPKVMRAQMPPAGCAANIARDVLGEESRLVSAFHNVAAHRLREHEEVACDVLVFGDDPDDREIVVGLAEGAGLCGIHAGPLANSVAAEALTSILIGINKRYGADGAGIRITGIKPR